MVKNLNTKVANATKWSAITELLSKLVAPISSMVLARLLTPEAFGIIATLNMVITFAEVFTDAGFQRYLIQKQFLSIEERNNTTTVAFWSNLVMSLFFWVLIIIFRNPLAEVVGNPGLGTPLAIACAAIPLAAFSSIQMSLFKKDLDFKTLFKVRLVGVFIPLLVTIPLAFVLKSFWALLIGSLTKSFIDALMLTWKSSWKPSFYFSIAKLKEMFSYCVWSLSDSILIWVTGYVDIFFIGVALNAYYLGLYKTSITTVGQITSIITAIIVPVLEPTFAKLQNDYGELKKTLFKLQKYLGLFLIPLGVGIYMYSDLVTSILLGDQWGEAAPFIGLWALIDVITILICRFVSNIFPAIGKPRISVICQMLYLAALVPGVMISVKYGFEALYYTRALLKLLFCVIYLIASYIVIKLSSTKMIINILPELTAAILMALFAYFLQSISGNIVWQFVSIALCIAFYFGVLSILPTERDILISTIKKFTTKIDNK